jgi:serine/threonine protein phosphatase 1
MSRTIVIGDIHGCGTALQALLDAIVLTSEDTLVTLGDYVDRGMETPRVIDSLLEVAGHTRLIPLLGNHEVMLLQAFSDAQAYQFWLQHGGQQTLVSYGGRLDQIPPHHRMFFQHCRRYWETDAHLFVHANYRSDLPLGQTPDETALWQHMKLSFPIPHESGKKVWVGHTPQNSGEILDLGHLAIVDTNCYGGGYLSAVDVESGEYWQVDIEGKLRAFAEA